jgi:hypothetical protein
MHKKIGIARYSELAGFLLGGTSCNLVLAVGLLIDTVEFLAGRDTVAG